jgi:integrase
MVKLGLRLPYLVEDVDRHGNVRLYVRIKGRPKVRIDQVFGSEEFMREYHKAVAGMVAGKQRRKVDKAKPGTLRWGAAEYFQSANFKGLDKDTQRVRRNIIERTFETAGDKPLRKITQETILKGRDRRFDTPAAANNFIKAMSGLFTFLKDRRHIDVNPVVGVKRLKSNNPDGWHTWTVDEIRQFTGRHPAGTQAHFALCLLLFVGCRRSDVVLLGRQHIKEGFLKFTATKNHRRKPVVVDAPVIAPLARALETGPTGDLTFLVTRAGMPFSKAGFGNKFRRWCNQAGLPHCSAHGLRKAGPVIAAENGATEAELNAIYGWTDAKMAAHYIKMANRRRLAEAGSAKSEAAMSDAIGVQSQNESVPLSEPVSESGTNSGKNIRNINVKN